jgi:hypothetical protein
MRGHLLILMETVTGFISVQTVQITRQACAGGPVSRNWCSVATTLGRIILKGSMGACSLHYQGLAMYAFVHFLNEVADFHETCF